MALGIGAVHRALALLVVVTSAVLLAVASHASAGGLSLKVHWSQDLTVVPVASQCSSAGSIGGHATIHLGFQLPEGYYSGIIREIRIHEDAGHYPDYVVTDIPLDYYTSSGPHVACGDPDPVEPGAPAMLYYDHWWPTTAGHNGVHTITAELEYTVMTGYDPATGHYNIQTNTAESTITIDVQNLVITSTSPANPEPIKWDPESMTQVTLTADVSAAYKASRPVKVTIYDSGQTVVRTITDTKELGNGTSTVTVSWDGGRDDPYYGDTSQASKGIYIFKWEIGEAPDAYWADYDSDKSRFLSIAPTRSELTGVYDDVADQHQLRDGCVLTDLTSPPADAAEAHVGIYDENLHMTAGQIPLPPVANSPGSPDPIWSEATYSMTIREEETHLFAARDNHATQYKNHRTRWALQHNKKEKRPRADCYEVIFPEGAAGVAQRLLSSMGYVAYNKGEQSAHSIHNHLQYDQVMFYSGGGALDVAPADTNLYGVAGGNRNGKRTLLTGFRNAATESMFPNLDFWSIRDDFLSPQTVSSHGRMDKVKLAVWLACYSGNSGSVVGNRDYRTGNVVDEIVNWGGAQSSVGFGAVLDVTGYRPWAETFFQSLKSGMAVRSAAARAGMALLAKDPDYMDSFRVAGNGEVTIRLH